DMKQRVCGKIASPSGTPTRTSAPWPGGRFLIIHLHTHPDTYSSGFFRYFDRGVIGGGASVPTSAGDATRRVQTISAQSGQAMGNECGADQGDRHDSDPRHESLR